MDSLTAWTRLLALCEMADNEFDDDAAADLVHLLCKVGDVLVLEEALLALTGPDPWRRQAAAWVLGEFGYERGRPFADRVMPALVQAARAEHDPDTRQAIVAAIGHADDPAWVPELLSYVDDIDPEVRAVVAGALPIMFAGGDLSAEAVTALLTLTGDVDPGVRDWATFSLGGQSSADSEVIRDALADRLDDDGGDTRFEAVLGLARRGDSRALEVLKSRLDAEQPTIYLLDLEAAAELAHPALMPTLRGLEERWRTDEDRHTKALAFAIERCDPRARPLAAAAQTVLVDRVNANLAGIGWRVEVTGDYPTAVLTVHRPDGSVETTVGSTPLWEGTSPTTFEADKEVADWTTTIRGVATADESR